MEGPTPSQPPPENGQDEDVPRLELPEQLQKITPATELPPSLCRWNSNEEIAAILIAFDHHKEWLLVEPRTRPQSGSLLLYNRKKVPFRRDGYCWKKRRDGKTNREDHMKLKVKGVECIYGSYVHSAILPTFHRRCYWLLQNPHVVLVHYLNVPNHPSNPKPSLMPILSGEMRKKEWTKEELVDQLRPMLSSGRQGELHPDQDHTVEETLEAIFQLLVSAQDDGGGPKPLGIDASHQHPVGAVAAASASPFLAHSSVVGMASHHPQVPCAPHARGKPEVGVLCLQQQSGQLGGCVSTMAHLQVSASALPDQHHHEVIQNQPPATSATTSASGTSPLAELHNHRNLQLPPVQHMAQQTAVPTSAVPSTLSPLTLATFSHVHLTSPSPSLQTGPVTRESHLHHVASPHDATGQRVIPTSVSLLPGLSLGSCYQGANNLPSQSVPLPPPSSDSKNLPHQHTFPSAEDLNLLKSADQQVSSPQLPPCLHPPPQQLPTTCLNGMNGASAQNQSLNTQNVIHLSPAGLVIKDGCSTVGGVANMVAFAATTNSFGSTPQVIQHHSIPGPSKDIPLFAANPLAQNGENNGCDVGVGDGNDDGGGVGVVGLADNSDNCDTLDGSFSSLPSTDLNLDLFLDLQDLEDCAADLAVATSLSPPQLASPPSPVISAHLPLATSSPLGCSSHHSHGGHSPSNNCHNSTHTSNHYSGTLPRGYMHSTMTTPNAQLLQPQTLGNKVVLPQVWGSTLTSTEIPTAQSHTHSVHGSPHLMPNDTGIDLGNKVIMNEFSGVGRTGQSQSRQPFSSSNPSSFTSQQTQNTVSEHSTANHGGTKTEHVSAICDFSPEWAYAEGNTKILVAGPWCNPRTAYTCVFDGKHVSATLVQAGVLRCFTPAHEPGHVVLQVAQDGVVISSSEVFEFCSHSPAQQSSPQVDPQLTCSELKLSHDGPHTDHSDWFDMSSQQLKQLLLERLGELERRFISGEKSSSLCLTQTLNMESQESSLLAHVEALTKLHWSNEHMYPKAGCGGLTLLHLVSALGYAKLISTLIRWRSSNPSPALEYEVDAHSVDNHACTPLMWACGKGQIDAALTLYHWNGGPLRVCNKDGHLPLAVARQRGHHNLATQVEQLEQAHFKAPAPAPAPAKIRCQSRESQVSSLQPTPESRPQPMSPETIKVEQPEAESNPSNMEQASSMQTSLALHTQVTSVSAGPGKLIRRFSEQVISPNAATTHHPLSKRYSVDLLTSDSTDQTTSTNPSTSYHMRDSTSEPRLPLKQEGERRGSSQESQRVPALNFVLEPDNLLNVDGEMSETDHTFLSPHGRGQLPMDTDEVSPRSDSPFIDVERVSSDDEQEKQDDSKHQMVTLANQIIAAMPERIKLSPSKGDDEEESSCIRTRSESHSSSAPSQGSPRPSSSSFGDDSGISTPMTDSLAFEEYRYTDFGTPASSLSPDSTCLPSPYSPYSFALDSPPPTTAEFTEYFNAPATYMEKDFSQLTLSDQEQRKLYEAAKVIQNAYRHYRDKQQQQQHQKEIEAAVLIQSYYRRYKQYAYYKKMTQAAVLIQNQFRSYSAQKRKKNPGGGSQGARRELERLKKGRNQSVIIQQRFRSHYQRKSLDGKDGTAPMGVGAGDAPDRELWNLMHIIRLPTSGRKSRNKPHS